jgi:hypothetical protein
MNKPDILSNLLDVKKELNKKAVNIQSLKLLVESMITELDADPEVVSQKGRV